MNAPFGILQPSTIFFFPSSPSLINYLLNAIDFDTGGIFDRLCDRRAKLDRLRRPWKFPAVAAVEVLHWRAIDPALAATPIARWQHVELPPNFLQFLNTLLLQFFEGVHRLGKGWVMPTS
jgi:hypothetical protein